MYTFLANLYVLSVCVHFWQICMCFGKSVCVIYILYLYDQMWLVGIYSDNLVMSQQLTICRWDIF